MLVVACAVLIRGHETAYADCDSDTCTRSLWGWEITVTAPTNWRPTEERSYPSILLWMGRRDPPGRMLFSVEKLDEELDSRAYARRGAKVLAGLGFEVRTPQLHAQTGAYMIDFDNGGVFLRQAFLVVGGIGYALTLSAHSRRTRGQHLRAFDYTLRTLKIERAPEGDLPGADRGESAAEEEPEN